jgi:ATP-binding cassette subfamily F protein 3
MLSGANLLLLDEPTNHLDVNSREALEEALLAFDGTLLAVSHDRYFIRKLASRIIEMTGNSLEDYKGDYAFYLDHRRQPQDQSAGSGQNLTAAKQEHQENKEEKARRRKLEKQLAACEDDIGRTEARLSEISDEMSRDTALSDHMLLSSLLSEQLELETKLTKLYEDWETFSVSLQELTDAQTPS